MKFYSKQGEPWFAPELWQEPFALAFRLFQGWQIHTHIFMSRKLIIFLQEKNSDNYTGMQGMHNNLPGVTDSSIILVLKSSVTKWADIWDLILNFGNVAYHTLNNTDFKGLFNMVIPRVVENVFNPGFLNFSSLGPILNCTKFGESIVGLVGDARLKNIPEVQAREETQTS